MHFPGQRCRDAPWPLCLQSLSGLSLVERFWGLPETSLSISCGEKSSCHAEVSIPCTFPYLALLFGLSKGIRQPWGLFCHSTDGSCCSGVAGNESGKRTVWLNWTGNGQGIGGTVQDVALGEERRLVILRRGERCSSNRIFLKGLEYSVWVCGNNFKPGFAWRGENQPQLSGGADCRHKSRLPKFPHLLLRPCIPGAKWAVCGRGPFSSGCPEVVARG